MPTVSRVVVSADRQVLIESASVPPPGPGEVLVRTVFAGVCGSDTHAQHGRHPHITLPYHPGHEIVGVVAELGDEVRDHTVGDRVVVEPTLPCWECKQCRARQENLCENLNFFGCGHVQGGMAELFTIPADRLHRIPDDMDSLTATLIEPLATPVHAARLAGPVSGRTVAILGAGTIGLLMLAVVRGQGAARIVVSDVLATKRTLAQRHGADEVVDAGADDAAEQLIDALGESADIVFDCVAIQSTVELAVALAGKNGTVVIVGVPSQPVMVNLPLVQDQQIRIQGSATYLPQDYRASIALLRQGIVPSQDFITGRYPLTQAADAFAASSGGEHLKVLVEGTLSPH